VFHLHRLGPRPVAISLGRGGSRWRDRLTERLPPPPPIGAFFERANRCQALEGWTVVPGRANRNPDRQPSTARATGSAWWCACLLETDLRGLGFQPVARSLSSDGRQWAAQPSGLPREIEHVFVIRPSDSTASFHRVGAHGSTTTLETIRTGRETVDNESWKRVRVQALDVALDELLTRMQ